MAVSIIKSPPMELFAKALGTEILDLYRQTIKLGGSYQVSSAPFKIGLVTPMGVFSINVAVSPTALAHAFQSGGVLKFYSNSEVLEAKKAMENLYATPMVAEWLVKGIVGVNHVVAPAPPPAVPVPDWDINTEVSLSSDKAKRIGQLVMGTSSTYRVFAFSKTYALAARLHGLNVSLRMEGTPTVAVKKELEVLGLVSKGAYMSGHLHLHGAPKERVFAAFLFNSKLGLTTVMKDLAEAKLDSKGGE